MEAPHRRLLPGPILLRELASLAPVWSITAHSAAKGPRAGNHTGDIRQEPGVRQGKGEVRLRCIPLQ